jgi:hypothetical protein
MRTNYTVKPNTEGRIAMNPRTTPDSMRPMCDGLESRTLFAAAPAPAMPPHMHPAIAIEAVSVAAMPVAFGLPHGGFEVIIIREGPMHFGPPPEFGDRPAPPTAVDVGDASSTTPARAATATRPSVTPQTAQVVEPQAAGMAIAPQDADALVSAVAKPSSPVVSAKSATVMEPAGDLSALETAPAAGVVAAPHPAMVAVENMPTLPAGMLSGIAAAFPAALGNGMTAAAQPMEQALTALGALAVPSGVASVFSAASPTDFLRAAAPGLTAMLSSVGSLASNGSASDASNSAAWRSAAVVGVGLAVVGYGYSAQRRKEDDAASIAGDSIAAGKKWELQTFDDR